MPVKTFREAEKSVPPRLSVTNPSFGAVQVHQTDLPLAWLVASGSPDSIVALRMVPVAEVLVPVRAMALAKLSFAGAAGAGRTVTWAVALSVLPEQKVLARSW